jgi:integrase
VQHCKTWSSTEPSYGKVWVDVPGQPRKRKCIALGVCATKSKARARLREFIEREGLNSSQSFHENTAPATTFREQAEIWLTSLATRRRKPVKPATIHGWRHSLNKWVLPTLGDTLLADVGNAALKTVIEKMSAGGLAAQSIVTHARVVKMVVASAVTAEGEEIYPRKWNHNFCGLPIIDPTKQHRPTVTQTELQNILSAVLPRYRVLVALLAGSGLRIGEALGLKAGDLNPSARYCTSVAAFGTVANNNRKQETLCA